MTTARANLAGVFALIASAIACSATAQEVPSPPPVELVSTLSVESGRASLAYANAVCPWECAIAVVTCEANGDPTLQFGLAQETVAMWLGAHPASQGLPVSATLLMDDTRTEFFLFNLAFSLLDANWWVELSTFDPVTDWVENFGRADAIMVSSLFFEIALTGAQDDQASRAAFAEACLAL